MQVPLLRNRIARVGQGRFILATDRFGYLWCRQEVARALDSAFGQRVDPAHDIGHFLSSDRIDVETAFLNGLDEFRILHGGGIGLADCLDALLWYAGPHERRV